MTDVISNILAFCFGILCAIGAIAKIVNEKDSNTLHKLSSDCATQYLRASEGLETK